MSEGVDVCPTDLLIRTRTHLSHQDGSDFSDTEDKQSSNSSLRNKFRQFQTILVLVQYYLGEVADMEEGVKK